MSSCFVYGLAAGKPLADLTKPALGAGGNRDFWQNPPALVIVLWDSDHVVLLDEPAQAFMQELVRGDYLGRTHIGRDDFDASINRLAAR